MSSALLPLPSPHLEFPSLPSPDCVATAARDGAVLLWDLRTSSQPAGAILRAHLPETTRPSWRHPLLLPPVRPYPPRRPPPPLLPPSSYLLPSLFTLSPNHKLCPPHLPLFPPFPQSVPRSFPLPSTKSPLSPPIFPSSVLFAFPLFLSFHPASLPALRPPSPCMLTSSSARASLSSSGRLSAPWWGAQSPSCSPPCLPCILPFYLKKQQRKGKPQQQRVRIRPVVGCSVTAVLFSLDARMLFTAGASDGWVRLVGMG
ncbi:unnamed protein product [Closterium sp. NIES-54]